MADAFFAALTNGAQFNKKKFANTVKVFQKQQTSGDSSASKKTLDFFGDDSAQHKKSKKLPKVKKEEDKEETKLVPVKIEDEEEVESSSQAIEKKSKKRKKAPKEETKEEEDSVEEKVDVSVFENLKEEKEEEEDAEEVDSDEDKSETPQFTASAKSVRKKNRITVHGNDVADPVRSFADMSEKCGVQPYVLRNLESSGYSRPTPIQMQAVPIMCQGRELLACAPTGSGKTAAYIIPTLARLKAPSREAVRAVILAPTRELVDQIHVNFDRLCKGKPWRSLQSTSVPRITNETKKGSSYDVVVSTPLRLAAAIEEERVDLSSVEILILDEADRLFDMGFVKQIDSIIAACNRPDVQRCLFSATLPPGVLHMANSFLRDPIRVSIGNKNAATETVDQRLVFVGSEDGKFMALKQMIAKGLQPPVLIFVQSIERANDLHRELVLAGSNADAMHADRSPAEREEAIRNFRLGKTWILICTELMSRGIDFKGVNCVINYDFPTSTASYVHRIGRTGRAGRKGEAVTFFTEDDADMLRSIANVVRASGCDIPEWMLSLKKMDAKDRRKREVRPIQRQPITTDPRRLRKYRMEAAQNPKGKAGGPPKKRQKVRRGKAQSDEDGGSDAGSASGAESS